MAMEKWKKYEVSEIFSISSDKYYPEKSEESFKCIELEHIEQETGRIIGFVSSEKQKSTKSRFKKGQVLYGKLRPYLRKYYKATFDGVCSTEIWVLESINKNLLNDYLFYLVQTNLFNKYTNVSSGTKMPRANWDYVSRAVFDLPHIKEQINICSILSSWDNVIDRKERLIVFKEKQKKGLMQKLLTGQKRLNDFIKPWKEVKLGNVLKERKETGYEDLELLAITMANGVCKRDGLDLVDNSSSDKSKYKRILPLDIGYNTMRIWQGVSGVSEFEGIISPAYTVLKPTDKVDSYFMGYLFQLPKVIDTFRRYSQGLVSDTLNLKYENFKGIKLKIPTDIEEQKAIANILKLQDKEIGLLKEEVNLLKEQKKGLMQLLLTGKVRVKC